MRCRIAEVLVFCSSLVCLAGAQDLKLFDHEVQVHGFATQAFLYTDHNNWLTTHSSQGSGAFTDFGFNTSTFLSDKLHVGAQVYDRNLGNLGEWHPSLDWAVADYKLHRRFGMRGGKVKTRLGLHNDTQDLDFLSPFILLPQSVYPTDLREATIAHSGGDLYGSMVPKPHWGEFSYTAYGGRRSDSIFSGYPYLLTQFGTRLRSYGGPQYGGDLRWNTPWRGLLVGASRMNEDISGRGTSFNPLTGQPISYSEYSRSDWTNQYYGAFNLRKLQLESEYRRYFRDQMLFGGTAENKIDVRGWYGSAAYRLTKRLEFGSYYSSYTVRSTFNGFLTLIAVPQTDVSLPANHVYDRVVAARFDIDRWWDFKVEGHFMDGYGNAPYPAGFYPQVNPKGFNPETDALVLNTGINF